MQAIKNASSREISAIKSKLAEAEAFIEATEGIEDELMSAREEMASMKEHFSRRERIERSNCRVRKHHRSRAIGKR